MKCPLCGTNMEFDFPSCPRCGYKLVLGMEQPLPNWRQLPGFRSKQPWKMAVAVMIYLWIILAIIVSLFSGM